MGLIIFRVVTTKFAATAHLANFLNRVDDNISVYVFGDEVADLKAIYPKIVFINIPIKRKISIYYDFVSIIKLSFYILKYKPQVIHSIMPKSGLISAISSFILKVPVRIHTYTGQIWLTQNGISKYFYIFIDKVINFLNTSCLTDSKSQSDFLKTNGVFDKKTNLPLGFLCLGSLSGVDLNKLNPNLINSNICIELKKKFNLHQSDFVITYMARKTLDKGALDMLEIFFILNNISTSKNIKLLYIGPDESNGIVEAYLEKNNFENIIVIGEVKDHQYYLGISNLLCLPSHKEGFGSVVIDAAAIGVPTIGYNIIGLKDAIIDNYTGWLINENDKELFANQIIQLIENEKLLFQISKNAYEYCKINFDADKYHLELLNKYYSEI